MAGTDSRVFITLYGKEGVGPRTRLFHDSNEDDENEERDPLDRKPPKGPFRKGKKDTFVISSDYHGPLTKIRYVHDPLLPYVNVMLNRFMTIVRQGL